MASLETTRGRQVPAWQRANKYYQQPVDYVAEMQPRSQSATAPATRKRRSTNGSYKIQKGDTLSAIAKRYGTTVQAIAEANGIADVNKIYVGDSLTIPGNTTAKTTSTPTQNRNAQSNITSTTQSRTLPEVNVRDTNNNIYRSNSSLPEVNVTSNRMNSNDAIAARYQRQINNQKAREEYYRNQRMAQGRQAEQRVATRPDYEGLRTFATTAAALPGAYLFGTAASAAAPYITEGANSRTLSEGAQRVADNVSKLRRANQFKQTVRSNYRLTRQAQNAIDKADREAVKRIELRAVRRLSNAKPRNTRNTPKPLNSKKTMKKVREARQTRQQAEWLADAQTM